MQHNISRYCQFIFEIEFDVAFETFCAPFHKMRKIHSQRPVFSGVCATRSLVVGICFVDRC